jgi:tRNA (guanine26-N2/guanine27-N2)-dimethyltransferase
VKLVEHVEGRTRLLVPAVSLAVDPPPISPVFFNPAAALNRDVSVCVTAATARISFCDSMAGVGARGIRVANEAGEVDHVVLVDFNRQALRVAQKAAALNGVIRKCEFAQSETSSYLYSRYGKEKRFDYVDVDPFGTPVGQLQGAIGATSDGGILSLTATDTAVLCGVYPKVARRRYGATPLNNHFSHETAIRLLAGAVARAAASLDTGARPIVAHSTRHYVRLFFSIETGATKGDSALNNLGHVSWCPSCGQVTACAEPRASCEKCGKKVRSAGPVWVGPLTDRTLLRRARTMAQEMGLERASETLGSLFDVDSFPPWSFDLDEICSSLGVATVPESEIYTALREMGHSVMRTPFEKTGLKTDAVFAEVAQAVSDSAALSGKGRALSAGSVAKENRKVRR